MNNGETQEVEYVDMVSMEVRFKSSFSILLNYFFYFVLFIFFSLAYSRDSQYLYASTSENVVVVWESGGSKSANKPPKFHNVTYL